jgi:very-short-patch-repair endonuclease
VARNRERARQLRRESTEAETFLWRQLRGRTFNELKFRRQFPVGNYIVDFVCLEKRLIIELDGGGHNEDAQRKYDAVRDEWLKTQGSSELRLQICDRLRPIHRQGDQPNACRRGSR